MVTKPGAQTSLRSAFRGVYASYGHLSNEPKGCATATAPYGPTHFRLAKTPATRQKYIWCGLSEPLAREGAF